MKFVGVRCGGPSVVGVAVPESGYAGDGAVEASLRDVRIPDRMAMPRVPGREKPC